LSAVTIRANSPWPQFETQRSTVSAPTTHDESGFHAFETPDAPIPLFDDADPIPLSIDDAGEATTGGNVIGGFRKAGIMSRQDDEHRELLCFIELEKASDVRHWNQIKRRIPLEAFSGEV
jgi:hypothetical protein